MQPLQIVLGYTGTGLSWTIRGVAGVYYREISNIWQNHELITLRRAGLGDPHLRHYHSSHISDRKHQKSVEPIEVELILWGHSQGGIEALWQLLRSRLPSNVRIVAVFLLSAPLHGSPAADLAAPLELVPWPISTLFTGITQMRPDSRSERALHDKLRVTMQRSDFCHPPLYLVGAQHDHLVPLDSAWNIVPDLEYPAEKLHLVRLIHGDAEAYDGVHDVQVSWGLDSHVGMPTSSDLHHFMAGVVGHDHPLLNAKYGFAA